MSLNEVCERKEKSVDTCPTFLGLILSLPTNQDKRIICSHWAKQWWDDFNLNLTVTPHYTVTLGGDVERS